MDVEEYRDPTPNEENEYRTAIKGRDAEAYLNLFQMYPTVTWSGVRKTLSDEDREWCGRILAKERNAAKPSS